MATANLNQNSQGVWNGNNVVVGKSDNSVDFNNHSSNACAITFGNSATFGMASTTVPGQTDQSLLIQSRESTTYELPGGHIAGGPQFDITVDTETGAKATAY